MGKNQSKVDVQDDSPARAPQPPNKTFTSIPRLDTDYLLQAPDESSIKRSWMQLSNLIDSHVQTFYDASNALQNERESIKKDLRRHHIVEEPREIEELAEMLFKPKFQKLGLRVCIARVVLSNIDFFGHPDGTSLDRDVVQLLHRFQRLRPSSNPEQEVALAHWRMITAFFLAPSSKDVPDEDFQCVELLAHFLPSYTVISEEDSEPWLASLSTIAQKSIELGEKLFAHPSTWSFEWHPSSEALPPLEGYIEPYDRGAIGANQTRDDAGPRPIVLFPALIEVPAGDMEQTLPLNVVQAADLGPGLAYLGYRIRTLSSLFSMKALEPLKHTRAASVGIGHEVQYREDQSTENSIHNDRLINNSSPTTPSRVQDDVIRPIRRASTMDSASRHRTSSSKSLTSHSHSEASRKKRDSRYK